MIRIAGKALLSVLVSLSIPVIAADKPYLKSAAPGGGTFTWIDTRLRASGTASSLKLDFRGSAMNQTGKPWAWVKFCVKAWDANQQLKAAASDCLIDLDAWDLAPDHFVTWKSSPKISVGGDQKTKVEIQRFEITFVDGGQEQPGVKRFDSVCGAVWGAAIQAFFSKGFEPLSSDKAGGILKLLWTKGVDNSVLADGDIRSLTKNRVGFGNYYNGFRVEGATAIFTDAETGCRLEVKVTYAGHQYSSGWLVLESKGRMERSIIEATQSSLSLGR